MVVAEVVDPSCRPTDPCREEPGSGPRVIRILGRQQALLGSMGELAVDIQTCGGQETRWRKEPYEATKYFYDPWVNLACN